tara:strand:+ start:46 stop:261 length:216 start_codon:yes stop_codon:yes gene_type:complete
VKNRNVIYWEPFEFFKFSRKLTKSGRNVPTSETSPTAYPEPRSRSFVTEEDVISTAITFTVDGRRFPTAIE